MKAALLLFVLFSATLSGRGYPLAADPIVKKSDAEKILGQPVTLTEDNSSTENGITRMLCTYAVADTEPSGRITKLFCVIDTYADSTKANNAFKDILKANTGRPGQSSPKGIGNDAWYHSDDLNFAMLVVRKNDRILRLKINKLPIKYSKQELLTVASQLMN